MEEKPDCGCFTWADVAIMAIWCGTLCTLIALLFPKGCQHG